MKFAKSQELENYLYELIDTNYLNMSMGDMFSEVVGNPSLTNKKEIELYKSKFHNDEVNFIGDKCFSYWELDDENEEDVSIFNEHILPSIELGDINKYLSNPYYQKIKIKDIKENDYSLVIDKYLPYELFALKDMESDSNYVEKNSISFFKDEFSFISLNYKDVTWMSITPNEIETMNEAVKSAKGKVIVYGLGLGYFPFMVSLKDEVKEIFIIENDINIINLFKKYLLPQFEHKDKITIIHEDAFKYMEEVDDFDYAFIDLWHDPNDGIELFLKAKRLEKENHHYFYWLESSFYLLLRRCFISLIEESLSNVKEENYQKSKSVTDSIINKFYYKTKNLVISSKEELRDLLSDNSLLHLMLK